MHLLGGADDRIDRASLDAQRASYAERIIDNRNRPGTLAAVGGIEWNDRFSKRVRKQRHAFHAARRALIVIRIAARDRFGVKMAGGIAAFGALGLRQQILQFLGQLMLCNSVGKYRF